MIKTYLQGDGLSGQSEKTPVHFMLQIWGAGLPIPGSVLGKHIFI